MPCLPSCAADDSTALNHFYSAHAVSVYTYIYNCIVGIIVYLEEKVACKNKPENNTSEKRCKGTVGEKGTVKKL